MSLWKQDCALLLIARRHFMHTYTDFWYLTYFVILCDFVLTAVQDAAFQL